MPMVSLKPGQNSIDRCKVIEKAPGRYELQWSLRHPDGRLTRHTSKGRTKGETRRRAHDKAEELLAAGGAAGTWRPGSAMTDYVRDVSVPLVRDSSTLRPSSRARYLHLLEVLAGEFRGYAIVDAVRFRRLEATLQHVAATKGSESARQAKNVLSKYVLQQLIREELLDHNPLAGMDVDLAAPRRTAKAAGGRALTSAEYDRVLDHLLADDPEALPDGPRAHGGQARARRVARRRAAVDLTLLQATTGLRITEARSLTWDDTTDDGTTLTVTVTPEVSKTHRGRTVPVLDARVADRLRERRQAAHSPREHVIGAPTDPSRPWDGSNAQKAVKSLLRECAEACSVPLLEEVSSHVWRATLNTRAMAQGVPTEVRAAYFGHGAEVNRDSYTDTTDTSALVGALSR